ncbi:hypothetical protein DFP96_11327 [Listeria rocourtiae]|uniref:Uncharacterized protein n=1 Tax=Listeria rocourtiae TaxID=647910 RepID=A0A4V3DP87_9LIST|nr:hypothetical protein DFP96_11327 [Listeria rocourtiae]
MEHVVARLIIEKGMSMINRGVTQHVDKRSLLGSLKHAKVVR